MSQALVIGVADAAKRLEGEDPHPFINVDDILYGGFEYRTAEAEGFGHVDDTRVVVGGAIVLYQVIPAIGFLVVTHVREVDRQDVVGRQLEALGIPINSVLRIVDQLELVERALRAVFVLGIEEGVIITGHHELRRAVEIAKRRNQVDNVIVHAARSVADVLEDQLAMTGAAAARAAVAVHRDDVMDALEQLIRSKAHVESGAVVVAAVTAALEMDAHVVIDVSFVVNDGGGHAVVAHNVCGFVEKRGIGWGHDDAEVVCWQGGPDCR